MITEITGKALDTDNATVAVKTRYAETYKQ